MFANHFGLIERLTPIKLFDFISIRNLYEPTDV